MSRRSASFCLTISLLAGLPGQRSAAAAGTNPAAPGPDFHVIRIDAGEASRTASLRLSPSRSIDYGSFTWMELNTAELASLRAAGVAFEEIQDAYTLRLGEQSFDPLVSPPELPAGWGAARSTGRDLQLVQFAGPTREEWLASLRATGADIVQYVYPFTYIVAADAAALDAARRQSNVRWTGPHALAYRVLPQWRNLPDRPVAVKVLLVRHLDTRAAVRDLIALGAKIEGQSVLNSTFEIASLELSGARFQAAAEIPGVYSIQVQPTDGGLRGEMSDQVCVNNVDGSNVAFPGYLTWLAGVGLSGAGVRIANVDGGVQETHPSLVNRFVPCSGTTCSATSSGHGTHTAGIMAADGSMGTLDGFGFQRGLGMAPGANLVEQVYSPWFTQAGGMLLLMKDSFNNGASLSGNSWGPAGTPRGYDNDTLQVDIGVRDADSSAPGNQPLSYVLSFMNGNGGTSTQGTPDEAKNIFTIGSTKMQTSGGSQILQIDDLSANSAHGPALDGRTIPHMVAPGCYVDSTYPTNSHSLQCGTSMASPHVSGALALFIQYYRGLPDYAVDPSPALIKAAFIAVARDLAGHLDADGGILGHPFDSKQGWGRMEVQKVVDPQNSVLYFDNPVTFDNTGEEWTRVVSADDPSRPMRLMLVWTDAPGHGAGGSTPAWNNNLDLVVQDGANTYRGNNFNPASGYSQTGGAADGRNNTEGVFIGPTAPGSYTVRVVAANINSDGVPNSGDATDQDFALVCYNCAGEPTFTLNATPASLSICAGAAAQYTINVGNVQGFSDPVTLSVSGQPDDTTATFSTNPVTPPGSSTLTIGLTDFAAPGTYPIQITGTSGAIVRSTTVQLIIANAVPVPPALSSPSNGAVNQPLRPTFAWSPSPQAATYDIQVATDAGFSNVVASASGLTGTSFQPASDLAIGTLHYWRVRSTSACGTGAYSSAFSFTTRVIPAVLLVDDDDNAPNVRSYYTTALNTLNQNYDVWDTNNTDNEPSAAQLSPYSIVIWFTGDEFGGTAGPGAAGESALASWLNTGRCLFISSQDYLWDRGGTGHNVPTAFMATYLGMANPGSSDVSQTTVTGANLFAGMGPYALSYPFTNFSDRISPDGTAVLAFSGNAGNAAISKSNDVYRTCFFGFPFEAIPTPADRAAVLLKVLNYCNPPCATMLGDMNATNDVNGDDIQGFSRCYLAGIPQAGGCSCADMDVSGSFNQTDIDMFVAALLAEGP